MNNREMEKKNSSVLFISLSSKETLDNSIHVPILKMLHDTFETVSVFCWGEKYQIEKENITYYSGKIKEWWEYQKTVPKESLIYINDFFMGGAFGVFLKRKNRSKLFLRCGSPWKYQLNSFSSLLKSVVVKMTKPFVIKNCDQVVYNSKAIVQHQYNHNYEVIYNGVDTDLFRPMQVPKVSLKLNLLFIGNLNPEKGLEYLFPAVVDVQEKVHLSIVGKGKLLDKYQQQYPWATFYGRVEHMAIPEIINLHDAVVLPTFVESFPNVILEAMACGKPVIATKVFGIPEMITSGEEGILVPPKESSALKEAILTFTEKKEVAKVMGKKGRKKVLKSFKNGVQEKKIQDLILMMSKNNEIQVQREI